MPRQREFDLFLDAACAYILSQFIIVVYGRYDGNLGSGCNHDANEVCSVVFRARSTVFATLIFQILLYAWELKSCESITNIFGDQAD